MKSLLLLSLLLCGCSKNGSGSKHAELFIKRDERGVWASTTPHSGSALQLSLNAKDEVILREGKLEGFVFLENGNMKQFFLRKDANGNLNLVISGEFSAPLKGPRGSAEK